MHKLLNYFNRLRFDGGECAHWLSAFGGNAQSFSIYRKSCLQCKDPILWQGARGRGETTH